MRETRAEIYRTDARPTLLGTYDSSLIPAGANGMIYALADGKLVARQYDAATPAWSFGHGTLVTAPIRVGKQIVVGSSSGQISVLSADDGSVVSNYQSAAAIAKPDE